MHRHGRRRHRPGPHTGPGFGAAAETAAENAHLERRTRPQQLLDGLIGACKAALAAGTLPATGGLRPQIMATISYQDLLNRLETAATHGPQHHRPARDRAPAAPPTPAGTTRAPAAARIHHNGTPGPRQARCGTGTGTGTFTYTGPVTPATIRKIACDADIIPVLLGSEGRILDIGRTTRHLPAPHPQSHHRPRPRLHLPQLHHPRPLVRSPPHHLLVTRRPHQHRATAPSSAPITTTSSTKNNGPSTCNQASPGSSPHPTSTPPKNPAATTNSETDHQPPETQRRRTRLVSGRHGHTSARPHGLGLTLAIESSQRLNQRSARTQV